MLDSKNWSEHDYYNYDDFIRVENNIGIVANYLSDMGYPSSIVTSNVNWNVNTIPTLENMNLIEGNIDELRNSFYTLPDWKNMKYWTKGMRFDYNDTNRYELNLDLLYKWGKLTEDSFIYCGEFNCGEEVI